MSQEWATKFYKSPAWLKNRKSYLMRELDTPWGLCPPYMCERCFERGILKPAKVVHHKKHLTPDNIDDPHVTLRYENFQRLCQECHAEVHSGQTPMRVTFNSDGTIAGPSETNSLRAQIAMLTADDDEMRNIHSSKN